MKLPESKYTLDLPEPIKVEETQVTTAPFEIAEGKTETSEEEELTPLLGTLQGLESEEIPQVNLQLAAGQLLKAEYNEPQALLSHEPQQYAPHESLTAEIFEATPHVHTDFSYPFETPNPGLLIAKGHVDGYWISVLFDTGCIGNIISLELCKKIGIRYRTKPECMSIMANQTLQEIAETTDHVTVSLGFYSKRMKFIVTPLRYDFVLGKSWKSKHNATIDCSDNYVNFTHAGNEYIIHDDETIKETSLGSLVNGYKYECPIFSVLLRNENLNYSNCVNKNAWFSTVLWEYSDVSPEELPKELPPKRTNEDFEIELKKGAKSIRKGLYRLSHSELDEIKKQVKHLIQMCFVRPSKSPWASPVLFASRKSVILRFFCRLSRAEWIHHQEQLPSTTNRQLFGSNWFGTILLDHWSARWYHQMWIAEKVNPKTAFSTRYGHYE